MEVALYSYWLKLKRQFRVCLVSLKKDFRRFNTRIKIIHGDCDSRPGIGITRMQARKAITMPEGVVFEPLSLK